ncbi:diguanylate cyclase [Halomonas sp.]|uniref:GGDEF domain-containing protein n=1 Tax=Halomonas sp. TaxID=1486246 RepID=UPI00261E18E7|nr:diguanylate cyclase [Halomonas sp.]
MPTPRRQRSTDDNAASAPGRRRHPAPSLPFAPLRAGGELRAGLSSLRDTFSNRHHSLDFAYSHAHYLRNRVLAVGLLFLLLTPLWALVDIVMLPRDLWGITLSGRGLLLAVSLAANHFQLSLLMRVYRQATHDPLTGLFNRGALTLHLEKLQAWRRQQGEAAPACSVLMMDIDHFKRINDTHGHSVRGVRGAAGRCRRGTRRPRGRAHPPGGGSPPLPRP